MKETACRCGRQLIIGKLAVTDRPNEATTARIDQEAENSLT
jgi:hypothetical protein